MLWGSRQLELEKFDRHTLRVLCEQGVPVRADCLAAAFPPAQPHWRIVRRSLRKLRVHGYVERDASGRYYVNKAGRAARDAWRRLP